MKVTIREILLLCFLLLVAWGYVAYTYILKPTRELVAAEENNLSAIEARERAAHAKIAELGGFDEKEKAEFERITEAIDFFFPELVEEKIINYVHNLAIETGLNIVTITADGTSLKDLNTLIRYADAGRRAYAAGELAKEIAGPDQDETNAGTSAPAQQQSRSTDVFDNAAYVYSFGVSFEAAGYEHIIAFMEGFEELGRYCVINGVTIRVNADKNDPAASVGGAREAVSGDFTDKTVLVGQFNINLMAIDSIIYTEAVFPDVELVTEFCKDNPFDIEWVGFAIEEGETEAETSAVTDVYTEE